MRRYGIVSLYLLLLERTPEEEQQDQEIRKCSTYWEIRNAYTLLITETHGNRQLVGVGGIQPPQERTSFLFAPSMLRDQSIDTSLT
jgi:hypothetical protein